MGAVVAVTAGAILMAIALWDAFTTIVLPRSVHFGVRPSRVFGRLCWRLWRWTSRGVPSRAGRQGFLSFFGPFSVLLLLTLWATMLLFAFALLHWGLATQLNQPAGFWTLLYLSGTTFFTLGLGDVVPLNGLGRGLVVVEVGTGIVFLAMIIGYLPLLDQAYAQREVGVHLLEARAGSPPSALLLLHRFGRLDNAAILYNILLEAERWAAELSQSHIAHVALVYYRSQHLGQSWLISLTTILDACALLIATEERPGLLQQAEGAFRMAARVAMDMARLLGASSGHPPADRLPPEEMARLRDVLRAAGVVLGPEAETRLHRLRRLYEPRVMALSAWLMVTLPPWVPALDRGDELDFGDLETHD